MIEVADIVLHVPSGEEWVAMRVTDTHLYWAGWPQGRALLADCQLVRKATTKEKCWMEQALRGAS